MINIDRKVFEKLISEFVDTNDIRKLVQKFSADRTFYYYILKDISSGKDSPNYSIFSKIARKKKVSESFIIDQAKSIISYLIPYEQPELEDYYEILGVERDASEEDIRKSWIELMKTYHPDKVGASEIDTAKKINEAYEILGDTPKRDKYNEMHMPHVPIVVTEKSFTKNVYFIPFAIVLLFGFLYLSGSGLLFKSEDEKQGIVENIYRTEVEGVFTENKGVSDEVLVPDDKKIFRKINESKAPGTDLSVDDKTQPIITKIDSPAIENKAKAQDAANEKELSSMLDEVKNETLVAADTETTSGTDKENENYVEPENEIEKSEKILFAEEEKVQTEISDNDSVQDNIEDKAQTDIQEPLFTKNSEQDSEDVIENIIESTDSSAPSDEIEAAAEKTQSISQKEFQATEPKGKTELEDKRVKTDKDAADEKTVKLSLESKEVDTEEPDVVSPSGDESGTEPNPATNVHIVKQGENTWLIARKYDITVKELLLHNDLSDNQLNIDDTLLIPNQTELAALKVKETITLQETQPPLKVAKTVKPKNINSDIKTDIKREPDTKKQLSSQDNIVVIEKTEYVNKPNEDKISEYDKPVVAVSTTGLGSSRSIRPPDKSSLYTFVSNYVSSYRNKDLRSIKSLFVSDATENGVPVSNVFSKYKLNFENTVFKKYDIKIISTNVENSEGHIKGNFDITFLDHRTKDVKQSRGKIYWNLIWINDTWKIRELNYKINSVVNITE